jgi:hypothetical protein
MAATQRDYTMIYTHQKVIFADSYYSCVSLLEQWLHRCEETNRSLTGAKKERRHVDGCDEKASRSAYIHERCEACKATKHLKNENEHENEHVRKDWDNKMRQTISIVYSSDKQSSSPIYIDMSCYCFLSCKDESVESSQSMDCSNALTVASDQSIKAAQFQVVICPVSDASLLQFVLSATWACGFGTESWLHFGSSNSQTLEVMDSWKLYDERLHALRDMMSVKHREERW